ncbi:MAG: MFS transporter [Clostridiales bacterium]|nr:MFS transporter [Clostridiales bacterium]
MDNKMKEAAIKAAPNRWFVFCVLTFSGGVAFKLSSLKDMFYVPMQQFMGLTNTQIGGALSVYGIVQTIGLIVGIYICDMFSKKYMIGGSLIGLGIVGLYISSFPGYWGFLLAFGVLAILGEVTYWPVLLKAVRLLGDEKTQGRMFGFLEMGRGIVDVIVASSALAIFKAMGEDAGALRAGILFLSSVTVLAGVFCLIFIPNDEKRFDREGKEVNKAQAAFGGMMQAIKSIDIWAVSLNGFLVYCIYCGLTYFIPFLNQIYMLPATAVGIYGMVNQYGLKMVGGPVGGFMSDKVHKSAAKHIRVGFVVCIIAMALFLIIPHEMLGQSGKWYLGAACTLGFGAVVFTMRAVFFAPMDEVKVPKEITGAAMSMASLIIYLPNAFAYVIYGNLLDRYPGITGFRIVYSIMIGWAVVGIAVSTFLIHRIRLCQDKEQV